VLVVVVSAKLTRPLPRTDEVTSAAAHVPLAVRMPDASALPMAGAFA
jgi:hypothetical protein